MNSTKNYIPFSRALLRWYGRYKRDLPWRGIDNPYQTWISEVMLQQTTVTAVIPKFVQWIQVFPDVRTLAAAPLQKVLKQWEGLGYYQRAKNLHRAAKMICAQYHAVIPQDKETLMTLPGLGAYTAGAILSIAYHQPIPIIDANIRRVIMRILALPGPADTRHDKAIYDYLQRVMSTRSPGNFNQALMELGALICDSRQPRCLQCPLRSMCAAYQSDRQQDIPQPIKTRMIMIDAVAAVIEHDQKFFIQQRPSNGLLGDLWEFPTAEKHAKESARAVVQRMLHDQLGVQVQSSEHYMKTHHYYTRYKIRLDVWKCTLTDYPVFRGKRRWVAPRNFFNYPFSSGMTKIITHLKKDDA